MKNQFKTNLFNQFFILIWVIIITSVNLNAQTKEIRNWVGTYTFTDTAQRSKRRNSYDVVPMIEYIITVKKTKDNQLTATFEANGMQTFEVYLCSVKATSDKLNFYFQTGGTPDGGMENPQNFKKGALLFSLEVTKIGAKSKYLFQPVDYNPIWAFLKMKSLPIHFQKSRL